MDARAGDNGIGQGQYRLKDARLARRMTPAPSIRDKRTAQAAKKTDWSCYKPPRLSPASRNLITTISEAVAVLMGGPKLPSPDVT